MFVHYGKLIICGSLLALVAKTRQCFGMGLVRRMEPGLNNVGEEANAAKGFHMEQGSGPDCQLPSPDIYGSDKRGIYSGVPFKLPSTEVQKTQGGMTLMEFHNLGVKVFNVQHKTMDDFVNFFLKIFFKHEFESQKLYPDLHKEAEHWMEQNDNFWNIEIYEMCRSKPGKWRCEPNEILEQMKFLKDEFSRCYHNPNFFEIFNDWRRSKAWMENYKDTAELHFSFLIPLYMDWAKKLDITSKYLDAWDLEKEEVMKELKELFLGR